MKQTTPGDPRGRRSIPSSTPNISESLPAAGPSRHTLVHHPEAPDHLRSGADQQHWSKGNPMTFSAPLVGRAACTGPLSSPVGVQYRRRAAVVAVRKQYGHPAAQNHRHRPCAPLLPPCRLFSFCMVACSLPRLPRVASPSRCCSMRARARAGGGGATPGRTTQRAAEAAAAAAHWTLS